SGVALMRQCLRIDAAGAPEVCAYGYRAQRGSSKARPARLCNSHELEHRGAVIGDDDARGLTCAHDQFGLESNSMLRRLVREWRAPRRASLRANSALVCKHDFAADCRSAAERRLSATYVQSVVSRRITDPTILRM